MGNPWLGLCPALEVNDGPGPENPDPHKGSLTILLGSVELNELVQRHTLLELNPIHGHGDLYWYLYARIGANGVLTELST